MTVLRVLLFCVPMLLATGLFPVVASAQPPGAAPDPALHERVMRMRGLLESARGGVPAKTYEEAVRYDRMSLEALGRGDREQALRCLDAGIALLAPAAGAAKGAPAPAMAPPAPPASPPAGAPGPGGPPPSQALLSVPDIPPRPADPATLLASPFGLHPASTGPGPNAFALANDLGARWSREPLYILWEAVQPDPAKAVYDFAPIDRIMAAAPPGMQFMWNLSTALPDTMKRGSAHVAKGSYYPTKPEAYAAFVRAAVARYGRAGREGRAPVRYWQVDNEPAPFKGARYAELVRLTAKAVREADPAARVVLGGVAGFAPAAEYIKGFDSVFRPYLKELRGKDFDVFDLHWFGNATGDYRDLGAVVAHVRAALAEAGFPPDMELWITEMGTYSGRPAPVAELGNRTFAPQTEEQQAADLLRRYVYALRLGVRKIFWAYGLVEGFRHDGGFFDLTGIVRRDGVKKAAFNTYRLMTRMLEGAALPPRVVLEEPGGTHAYAFARPDGKSVIVAWSDAPAPGQAAVPFAGASARVTGAVGDAGGAPQAVTAPASAGAVRVDLGRGPVFIEDN